jgi:hypothetical protein
MLIDGWFDLELHTLVACRIRIFSIGLPTARFSGVKQSGNGRYHAFKSA